MDIPSDREARRAAALRDNLRRRKQQLREASEPPAPLPDDAQRQGM